MADGRSEFLWHKLNANIVYNMLNVRPKFVHTIQSRVLLKDFDFFFDWLVREFLIDQIISEHLQKGFW